MARLTLYGMLQYDNTLLNGILLPQGIERDLLKAHIIKRSGDLYPYYQVPPILKDLIANWFIEKYSDFEKIYNAYSSDYNPIENYDRREDSKRTLTDSGSDKTTNTLGSTRTVHTENTLDTVTTDLISAADADTFQNQSQTEVAGTPESTSTDTGSGSDQIQTDYGKKNDDVYESRIHGNIGVTTSQQMLESEISLRTRYNIYELIAGLFEQEFITQLY